MVTSSKIIPLISVITSVSIHGILFILVLTGTEKNSSGQLKILTTINLTLVEQRQINQKKPKAKSGRMAKSNLTPKLKNIDHKILSNKLRDIQIKKTFFSDLRYLVEKSKYYPATARALGQQGAVKVSFIILENGKISDVKVVKSSRFSTLDQAAVNTMKKIGAYRPLPSHFNTKRLEVIQNIKFEL